MNKIKDLFGANEEPKNLVEQIDDYLPSLSYKQRFYGFITCSLIASFFIILSCLIFLLNPILFAFLYTIANILLLLATGFLVGFIRQCKAMFKSKRIWATMVFFFTMIITLLAILWLKNVILALISVIIQLGAFWWYALSYIPYARNSIKYMGVQYFSV